MKTKLLSIILSMLPIFALSQNNIEIGIGASFSPMLHTQETRNLQQFSMTPNLIFTIGSKELHVLASFGVISKIGTLATTKYLYGGIYYVINTITAKVEHGAEIEIGYNNQITENIRFFAGVSIGMLVSNEQPKINLRPFNIGVCVSIFGKKTEKKQK